MGAQRLGWYDVERVAGGIEIRQRPGLCVWLGLREARRMLSPADAQRVARYEVTRGMRHGATKPVRKSRRFHVAFFDARGERVGPKFHFAREVMAHRFIESVTPSAQEVGGENR